MLICINEVLRVRHEHYNAKRNEKLKKLKKRKVELIKATQQLTE